MKLVGVHRFLRPQSGVPTGIPTSDSDRFQTAVLTLLPHEELSSYPKGERCHGRGTESDIENLRCEVFLSKQRPSSNRSPQSTSVGAHTKADKTLAA